MDAAFADHFSGHAGAYAAHRPQYPVELPELVASVCRRRRVAWDCATGNGQAAVAIASYFERVVATDASVAQLRHAPPHPRIRYACALAERTPLADGSVDLVVVAQAMHWFDFDRFYAEARRVLAADGVLTTWAYGLHRITPAVDAVVARLYDEIVGPFWPERRRHIDAGYATIPFPFEPVGTPEFAMRHHWTLAETIDYIGTWSAVRRYRAEHGHDPLDAVRDDLAAAWGAPAGGRREIVWPLFVRVGRPALAPH